MSQSLTDRLPSFGKDRYREQLLAARMAEQSGEQLRARKSYEELLKKQPDSVDLHHRLGVLCQKAGDEAAAISYLKKAHELSPTNVEVLCDLGYSHYLQGRSEEAVSAYRQAQQINPSHVRTQSNLGIALIGMGEISAAMTTLRQSMSEADAASTVGFVLAQKGDLLQAREYFTRSLDADPTSQKAAEALVQIGELLAAESGVSPAAMAAGPPSQLQPESTGGTVPSARPETVDFESLYSQKVDSGTSGPVPSATNAEVVNGAAVTPHDAASQSASGTNQSVARSFADVEDRPVEKLLPPIESVDDVSSRSGSRNSGSGRPLLSHTSLRLTESDGVHQFSQLSEESPDADIAAFVDSVPVEGVRSVESRRRSGGLIEPMKGAATRQQAIGADKKVSEKTLPPVETIASHGSHRRESPEPGAAKSENTSAVAAATGGAVNTAATVVANAGVLPAAPLQAVPQVSAMSGLANGMQMVLVRDASGQVYYVPMLLPTNTATMPQSAMPIAPTLPQIAFPAGVQLAGYQQNHDPVGGYGQLAPATMPQIYVHGQPVNSSAAMPAQMQPRLPQTGWNGTAGVASQYSGFVPGAAGPQNFLNAQPTPAAFTAGVPQDQYLPAVPEMAQTAASGSTVHPRGLVNPAEAQPHAQFMVARQGGAAGTAVLPSMQPASVSGPSPGAGQVTGAAGTHLSGNQQSSVPATSPSAAVGGLPLAFLRSFYSQMSAEQQAIFWRDTRQSGGGSAAERAAYRELAESSGGQARIEAAITMLMVFNEQALAEKMLAQCAESSDPTVQQAARTALSMLPLQNAGRR